MSRAYLSVGSNVDREANIRSGLGALRDRFGELTVSTVYRTRAVGFDGEDFYNLAVGLDTGLSPHELSGELHRIEAEHGRQRGHARFAPRTLDLDLLLYDDLVLRSGGLVLPRDEILRYAFVLAPLAQIAGQLRHPLTGVAIRDLWREFDASAESMVPVDLTP